MPEYFPADVSLRVTGEIGDAQKLFPVAKQLLARAVRLKETGLPLVRLFIPGKDGSLVHVRLHQELKHVYVQPGKLVKKEEKEVLAVPTEVEVIYLMLSGLVRPGTLVEESAHEFHPTRICSSAYGLEYVYQDMPKLGIESISVAGHVQARSPKPSMYSGAMKRVVQALYGLGKVGAESLTEELTGLGEIVVRNQYRCDFNVTNGILNDGLGVWLIEIDKNRGVLKMPLPIIFGTEADAYLEFIKGFDDTETAGIIEEFGGLPSGETFPVNDPTADPPNALDLAIAEGTVKRLLSADDLHAFYQDSATGIVKAAIFANCGWAFSESGHVASVHNTSFWYTDITFAQSRIPAASVTYELLEADATMPTATVAPLDKRALKAEHWSILLSTSGTTLSLVEAGLLAGPRQLLYDSFLYETYPWFSSMDELFRIPASASIGVLDGIGHWGRPPNVKIKEMLQYAELNCPVYVFYKGDTLEVVRHQREKNYSSGYSRLPESKTSGGFAGASDPDLPPSTRSDPYDIETVYNPDGSIFSITWKEDEQNYVSHGSRLYLPGITWDWIQNYSFKVTYTFSSLIPPAGGYIPGPAEDIVIGPLEFSIAEQTMLTDLNGDLYDPAYSSPSYSVFVETGGFGLSYVDTPVTWSRLYPIPFKRSGAFYSTSIDLRETRQFGNVYSTSEYAIAGSVGASAPYWEASIGFVISAFVHDGLLFPKYRSEYSVIGGTTTHTNLGDLQHWLFVPAIATTPGLLSTIPLLQSNDGWRKVINASHFEYAISANAGPTLCGIIQNVIYADVIYPGLPSEVLTPLPSYIGAAGGIPVTDCTAPNSTFVGAV